MEPDGYEIPIHRSLTEEMLMGGVPRPVALINGTIAAALGLGFQSFYALPCCLIIHLVFVAITKRDPQCFDVFKRHLKQKSYYSA